MRNLDRPTPLALLTGSLTLLLLASCGGERPGSGDTVNAAPPSDTSAPTTRDEPTPAASAPAPRPTAEEVEPSLQARYDEIVRAVEAQDADAVRAWLDAGTVLGVEPLIDHALAEDCPTELIDAWDAAFADLRPTYEEMLDRQVERYLARRPDRGPDALPDKVRVVDPLTEGWEFYAPGKVSSLVGPVYREDLLLGTLRFRGLRTWYFHDGERWRDLPGLPPAPEEDSSPLDDARTQRTSAALQNLATQAQVHAILHSSHREPLDEAEFFAFVAEDDGSSALTDGWDRPIVLRHDGDTDWFGSAGPDGELHTADDLWMSEHGIVESEFPGAAE